MKENNKTVLVDWDEKAAIEADPLTEAYAELGKAFYDYRFEEPTPELLLYFDKITALKSAMNQTSKRGDHLEPLEPNPTVSSRPASHPAAAFGGAAASAMSPTASYENGETVIISQPEIPEAHEQTRKEEPSANSVIRSLDELPDLSAGSALQQTGSTPASKAAVFSKYCPECGSKISEADLFCGNCGYRLK